jgi:hypothetical protein
MFIDNKKHIIGDFKLLPNLYENEDNFTVYYKSFIIGTLRTKNEIKTGDNCIIFNIYSNSSRAGTITITPNTYANHSGKLYQKYTISKVDINLDCIEGLKAEFVNKRQVLFEKIDNLTSITRYGLKQINKRFYETVRLVDVIGKYYI